MIGRQIGADDSGSVDCAGQVIVYGAGMANQEMLTDIRACMLADAFPTEHSPTASRAAEIMVRGLAPRQWTERFSVCTMGQTVSIPARLHFAAEKLPVNADDDAWPFVRALQTRSNDGYERQRAARGLLINLQPWGAPFHRCAPRGVHRRDHGRRIWGTHARDRANPGGVHHRQSSILGYDQASDNKLLECVLSITLCERTATGISPRRVCRLPFDGPTGSCRFRPIHRTLRP